MWIDTRSDLPSIQRTHKNEEIIGEKIRRLQAMTPPQDILTGLRLRLLTRRIWGRYPKGSGFHDLGNRR